MIWPIIARYMVAFTAGATWNAYPVSAKVLWVVILVALVMWDTREVLRRDRDSRTIQRARQLGEDRQVCMKSYAVEPTDPERE